MPLIRYEDIDCKVSEDFPAGRQMPPNLLQSREDPLTGRNFGDSGPYWAFLPAVADPGEFARVTYAHLTSACSGSGRKLPQDLAVNCGQSG